MKKGSERSSGFFGMGTSLLMTAFLVLMLVTFSLMSLATARNDLNRSQQLAQRRSAYYDASNQAMLVLHRLNCGEDPGVQVEQEGEMACFRINTTNEGVLSVNLRLHDGFYRIIRWEMLGETHQESRDKQ